MAMSDEIRREPKFKEKKPKIKKSFAERFIPMKTDGKKEIIGKLTVIVSFLVLIACGVILGQFFYRIHEANELREKNSKIYRGASQFHVIDPNAGSAETAPDSNGNAGRGSAEDEVQRKPLVMSEAAARMIEVNGDYAGYVIIPNCVEEAYVQSEDNDYYLDRNFYGQKRAAGTVFADSRNVINDYDMSDNIVLYGHNNKDGTMFGNLDYYNYDRRYWLKNPFVYFDTRYEQQVYVIISSFITNTEPQHDNGNVFDYHNYVNFSENGDYTFDKFYSEIMERSHFFTGIDVNKDDKFITLSTCSYEWEPSRHVIIARKLRAGETPENIDTTGFSVNSNPKWPAVYYKYNGGSYQ